MQLPPVTPAVNGDDEEESKKAAEAAKQKQAEELRKKQEEERLKKEREAADKVHMHVLCLLSFCHPQLSFCHADGKTRAVCLL